jgi:hypothetical protein
LPGTVVWRRRLLRFRTGLKTLGTFFGIFLFLLLAHAFAFFVRRQTLYLEPSGLSISRRRKKKGKRKNNGHVPGRAKQIILMHNYRADSPQTGKFE